MYVSVNGVRLFFDVFGEKLRVQPNGALKERPTLVVLHGGPGGDHQSLRPGFDRFAERCQIIYLDQRGGGRSEHGPASGWSLDQWGDDVAGLCAALGIVKPILLGVSGGAMVALSCIARHPTLAGGAILVNACARLDMEEIITGFGERGGPVVEAAARGMYGRGAMEDLMPFMQHCLPLYSRRAPVGLPADGSRTTFHFAVSQHFFNGGGEGFRFDFRDKLSNVSCPVLALAGAHDPITQPQWGREVADALPAGQAEFVLFEESSHTISTDEPERFFETVERFIDRVSA
jgi:pimeloyl-ACP methyl ester carboxylesterase